MKRTILLCAGALALMAGAANAQVLTRCDALNNRPAPIWGEFGTNLSIQDAVDAMVWGGVVPNCGKVQTRHSVFRPGWDRTVAFTFAGGRYFGDANFVGVYEVLDPSNKVVVFEGEGLKRGDQVLLTFLPNGDVIKDGQLVGQNFSSCFGLYTDVYAGSPLSGGDPSPLTLDWTFYSEDALNKDGSAQMLSYMGHSTTWMRIPGATHIDPWLFGDDEILTGIEMQPLLVDPGLLPADRDYNEVVLFMQGVKAIRPPGIIAF